jgi:hypothetical protein
MHYNSNHANGSASRKYPTRKLSINKLYTRSIAWSPTIIQVVGLLVMWAVGMMLIFSYTDVFHTSITLAKGFYYLLIIGSTTVLIVSWVAFFRRR